MSCRPAPARRRPSSSRRCSAERLRCHACGHQCPIPDGAVGVCKVRFNDGGRLRVPWGYVGGVQCDPVEKKPFFHAYPGALAYSFGMLGCDLHCSYCQNWVTSQALRDPHAVAPPRDRRPQRWSTTRLRQGARIVVSTYNEPLITVRMGGGDLPRGARAAASRPASSRTATARRACSSTCGRTSTLYKVDLKSFDDRHYRELGGRLQPILDTIAWLHAPACGSRSSRCWCPASTTATTELRGLTEFIAGVSPDIPWHVTAFHQDYRMTDPANTTPAMLMRAARDRRAGRACDTSTPAISPAGSASSNTRTAPLRRAPDRALRLFHSGLPPARPDGGCPHVPRAGSRAAGSPLRRPAHGSSLSAARSHAAFR